MKNSWKTGRLSKRLVQSSFWGVWIMRFYSSLLFANFHFYLLDLFPTPYLLNVGLPQGPTCNHLTFSLYLLLNSLLHSFKYHLAVSTNLIPTLSLCSTPIFAPTNSSSLECLPRNSREKCPKLNSWLIFSLKFLPSCVFPVPLTAITMYLIPYASNLWSRFWSWLSCKPCSLFSIAI